MLSQKHNSINLGQGFPDWNPPDYVVAAAQRSISGTASPLTNQYSRSAGMPRLCQAIAAHYSESLGAKLDWQSNVAVTVGATEGIFASCMALLSPGDECIIIEPYYDSYPASVRMAGAVPVCVPLLPPVAARSSAAWKMDWSALDAAASPRTKMIIVNSPHNPTGKLFDSEELHRLAAFAQRHNAYVLADEVYEHITFDGAKPLRMSQITGMWDRTLTLGSAGKTFSATGWKVWIVLRLRLKLICRTTPLFNLPRATIAQLPNKLIIFLQIGWAVGPPALCAAVTSVRQWTTFCGITPLQEAVAVGFEQADAQHYFTNMKQDFQRKRDALVKILESAGLMCCVPQGGYFIMANTHGLSISPGVQSSGAVDASHASETKDTAWCKWLTTQGVTSIPPSAFYSDEHAHMADGWARFAFCKQVVLQIQICIYSNVH